MSLSSKSFRREVYGVLDLMGDVGGLLMTTRLIMFGVVFIINYNGHILFIMSQLLSKDKTMDPSRLKRRASVENFARSPNRIRMSCFRVLKFNCQMIGSCVKKSSNVRNLERDYKQMRQEIDLVNLLRNIMVLKACAIDSLGHLKWRMMYKRHG